MRILQSTALVGLLGFCAYGLLSTLEPIDRGTQLRWRIGYGCLAAILVALLTRVWWNRGPRGDQ